jgi:hypothetical protein
MPNSFPHFVKIRFSVEVRFIKPGIDGLNGFAKLTIGKLSPYSKMTKSKGESSIFDDFRNFSKKQGLTIFSS